MQNEIRTRISVSQDGGNLVPRVRVTLDQQLGNLGSENAIKDGRHLGLNLNRRGTERVFFILRLRLPSVCLAPVHSCETQAQGKENFSVFLCWRLRLRCGSSHLCFLLLALAFELAFTLLV